MKKRTDYIFYTICGIIIALVILFWIGVLVVYLLTGFKI